MTNSDLINRQDAIDVLSLGKEILSRVLDNTDIVGIDREKYSFGLKLIESDIEDIKELPPAQPEPEELDFVQPHKKIGVRLEIGQPEPQWIPCSDPSDLPKDKRLWITREISDGFFTLREVSDVIWDMTEWSGSVSNVVAYMPYWEPEPYKERLEDDCI